jgi:hypothetical protein
MNEHIGVNEHGSSPPRPGAPRSGAVIVRTGRRGRVRPLTALAAVGLTAGAVLLGGCGSASKPAYCTQVANFEKSVQALGSVSFGSSTSGLLPVLANVESSAKSLAGALKSEFGPQVTTLKSSIVALGTSAKQLAGLSGSQALTQAAATIPAEVTAVKAAATNLQNATKSNCQ